MHVRPETGCEYMERTTRNQTYHFLTPKSPSSNDYMGRSLDGAALRDGLDLAVAHTAKRHIPHVSLLQLLNKPQIGS